MAVKEALTSIMHPVIRQLVFLQVKQVEDYDDHNVFVPQNRVELVGLGQDSCDFEAHHEILVPGFEGVYRIKSRVRTTFILERPLTREQIEERLQEIEHHIFSPTSLITAFITDQMVYSPSVIPPLSSK